MSVASRWATRLLRLAPLGAALTTLLVAQIAHACPVCAQREDGGLMSDVALGALIVAPWIVAGAVALYIRRLVKAEQGADGSA